MTRRRLIGSHLAAIATLAVAMSESSSKSEFSIVRNREYDDIPCQPAASDFYDGHAVNRHEMKIRKQDQKRFQQKQQAKFNMKGRR